MVYLLFLLTVLASEVLGRPYQSVLGYGSDPLTLTSISHVSRVGSQNDPNKARTGSGYLAVVFDIPNGSTMPAAMAASNDFNSSRSNKDKGNFLVSTWGRTSRPKDSCTLTITISTPGGSTPIASTKPFQLSTKYQQVSVAFSVPGNTDMVANYNVQCEGGPNNSKQPAVFLDDTSIVETY